jgi:hypothetical protein
MLHGRVYQGLCILTCHLSQTGAVLSRLGIAKLGGWGSPTDASRSLQLRFLARREYPDGENAFGGSFVTTRGDYVRRPSGGPLRCKGLGTRDEKGQTQNGKYLTGWGACLARR